MQNANAQIWPSVSLMLCLPYCVLFKRLQHCFIVFFFHFCLKQSWFVEDHKEKFGFVLFFILFTLNVSCCSEEKVNKCDHSLKLCSKEENGEQKNNRRGWSVSQFNSWVLRRDLKFCHESEFLMGCGSEFQSRMWGQRRRRLDPSKSGPSCGWRARGGLSQQSVGGRRGGVVGGSWKGK